MGHFPWLEEPKSRTTRALGRRSPSVTSRMCARTQRNGTLLPPQTPPPYKNTAGSGKNWSTTRNWVVFRTGPNGRFDRFGATNKHHMGASPCSRLWNPPVTAENITKMGTTERATAQRVASSEEKNSSDSSHPLRRSVCFHLCWFIMVQWNHK